METWDSNKKKHAHNKQFHVNLTARNNKTEEICERNRYIKILYKTTGET
jgi:hypothetical protein